MICGDNDRETIRALDGDDTIFAGGDAFRPKTVVDDTVAGGPGNDTIFGEGGLDRLGGNAGNDTLDGGLVSDNLRGGTGADVLIGGQGIHDTAIYGRFVTAPLTIDLSSANGANDGAAGEGDDVRDDVEGAIGGQGADLILGNDGHNTLWGRGGADRIIGGLGADALYGERGFDKLETVDSRRDQLRCGPDEGALSGGAADVDAIDDWINCDATIISTPGGPPPGGGGPGGGGGGGGGAGGPCSNLIGGSKADDDLRGTPGSDMMRGRGGNDRLIGKRGADCMRGGKGDDKVRAGRGKDKVRSRDGTPELIRCGAGKKDRAIIGPNDRALGCEKIKQRHGGRGGSA